MAAPRPGPVWLEACGAAVIHSENSLQLIGCDGLAHSGGRPAATHRFAKVHPAQPTPPDDAQTVRHCWVTGPAEDPGLRPGLILKWRRDTTGWWALVVYAMVT